MTGPSMRNKSRSETGLHNIFKKFLADPAWRANRLYDGPVRRGETSGARRACARPMTMPSSSSLVFLPGNAYVSNAGFYRLDKGEISRAFKASFGCGNRRCVLFAG